MYQIAEAWTVRSAYRICCACALRRVLDRLDYLRLRGFFFLRSVAPPVNYLCFHLIVRIRLPRIVQKLPLHLVAGIPVPTEVPAQALARRLLPKKAWVYKVFTCLRQGALPWHDPNFSASGHHHILACFRLPSFLQVFSDAWKMQEAPILNVLAKGNIVQFVNLRFNRGLIFLHRVLDFPT